MITQKRLSELADRLANHIAFGRVKKALLIAQYLRHISGHALVKGLQPSTGYSRREATNG